MAECACGGDHSPSPGDGSRDVIRLDVRPLLAGGMEPFAVIMDTAARVPQGGSLVLDAPFDPAPLRRILSGQGFAYEIEWLGDKHCRVTFRRTKAKPQPTRPVVETDSAGAKIWRDADGVHIDVRNLAPPNPMLAVIRLIERPDCAETVVMHHDREPIFLLPELAERGWHCEQVPAEAGEMRFRLTRTRP